MKGTLTNNGNTPAIGLLLVDARQAAAMLGLGRTSFLLGDRDGTIGPRSVSIGRRRLWSVRELDAWTRYGCMPRGQWLPLWEQIREVVT